MPRGVPNKKYTGEFKQRVVEDVIENKLSQREAAAKYGITNKTQVMMWERIYLTEGAEALYIDRRGRSKASGGLRKGRPPKFSKQVEEDLLAEVQRLRAENDYLKKLNALVSERVQREKTQVVMGLRQKHKLAVLLDVAKLSRATYYYHLKRMAIPDKYADIKEQIVSIYDENKKRVGYRRITLELHNRGICINHKTVQRLMKQLGLFCRVRIKKYNSYSGEVGKIAPNLLDRNFEADKPNQKWVTDITEFSLCGQKLYLSPIMDLHSRDIVSYTISERPRFAMVADMLEQAVRKVPAKTDLILHSDQGWQYQHKQYRRMLEAKGIRQSMSRKGNCLDNAVIENFFGVLKSELLYLQEFESMEHFKRELISYLDYYNNRRIKAKLKGLPPALHRLQALLVA